VIAQQRRDLAMERGDMVVLKLSAVRKKRLPPVGTALCVPAVFRQATVQLSAGASSMRAFLCEISGGGYSRKSEARIGDLRITRNDLRKTPS
jgi:hypothetical protein